MMKQRYISSVVQVQVQVIVSSVVKHSTLHKRMRVFFVALAEMAEINQTLWLFLVIKCWSNSVGKHLAIIIILPCSNYFIFPFTAVPTTSGDETVNKSVFDGAPTELTCPISLGALANHLDPYTFSWESLNPGEDLVPVNANNNRTLTIFVDENTSVNVYRCVLHLRRCDITRTNGSPRCPTVRYFGYRTQFEVFGKDDCSLECHCDSYYFREEQNFHSSN